MREYEPIMIPMGRDMIELDGDEKAILIGMDRVYYQEGVYYNYDERTDEYQADFALTYFYKDNNKPEEYLYFEQDSPMVALHNLKNTLHAADVPAYDIDLDKLNLCDEFVIRQLYELVKQENGVQLLMHRLTALGIIAPMEDVLEEAV